DRTARVWELDGTGRSFELKGTERNFAGAAFGPDGKRLFTITLPSAAWIGEQDGTSRFLPQVALTGLPKASRAGPESTLVHPVFSSGGQHAAAATPTTVFVWQIKDPGHPRALKGFVWGAKWLMFSPDTKRFLSVEAFDRQTARVWALDDPERFLE